MHADLTKYHVVCYRQRMGKKDGPALLAKYETEHGLTHEQVAKKLKTTGATISRLVTRERGPGIALAVRMWRSLGIPVEAWTNGDRSRAA